MTPRILLRHERRLRRIGWRLVTVALPLVFCITAFHLYCNDLFEKEFDQLKFARRTCFGVVLFAVFMIIATTMLEMT